MRHSLSQQNHDFDGSVEMFEELAGQCTFSWCAPARCPAWLH